MWECILNNQSATLYYFLLPPKCSKLLPSQLPKCPTSLRHILQYFQSTLWVHPKCRCAVKLTACSNLQWHNARNTYQFFHSSWLGSKNAFNGKHLWASRYAALYCCKALCCPVVLGWTFCRINGYWLYPLQKVAVSLTVFVLFFISSSHLIFLFCVLYLVTLFFPYCCIPCMRSFCIWESHLIIYPK